MKNNINPERSILVLLESESFEEIIPSPRLKVENDSREFTILHSIAIRHQDYMPIYKLLYRLNISDTPMTVLVSDKILDISSYNLYWCVLGTLMQMDKFTIRFVHQSYEGSHIYRISDIEKDDLIENSFETI